MKESRSGPAVAGVSASRVALSKYLSGYDGDALTTCPCRDLKVAPTRYESDGVWARDDHSSPSGMNSATTERMSRRAVTLEAKRSAWSFFSAGEKSAM